MALYHQVRTTLEDEIASGVHPVGGRFPTDMELGKRFGISRHTVRAALRDLQARGILARHRGLGTVVAALPADVFIQRFAAIGELDAYAAETKLDLWHEGYVTLRDGLAATLDQPVGERWLRLAGVRRRNGDGMAVCWSEVFVAEPFAHLCERGQVTSGPVYRRILGEQSVKIARIDQTLRAIQMPDDTAHTLGVAPGGTAMMVRRKYHAEDGRPWEISLSLHPGERYAFTSTVTRDDGRPAERDR